MINTIIIYTCISIAPSYQLACRKSVEAGLIQTGIKDKYTLIEKQTLKRVENQVDNNIKFMVSMGYYLASQKAIEYSLSTKPIADIMTLRLTPTKLGLSLGWSL